MFFKCYLLQTFRNFKLQLFSYRLYFLINLFLTAKTIFNWNFQSIATSTVQPFVAEYLRKKCGDLNEVFSGNDDDKDGNDGDADSKNV